MHLILSNIGTQLPDYIGYCLEQTRKFYDGKITLVTNSDNNEIVTKYNVNIYIPNMQNERFKFLENVTFSNTPNREFWVHTLARLFFIEDFAVENKIENFVTYDNDVLIYSSLEEIINKFSKLYSNIAITMFDDIRAVFGFSYFKTYGDLIRLNDDIIEILKKPEFFDHLMRDFLSEMLIIRKISKDKDYVKPIPILPTDENYSKFGFIFDPLSYGQFLGGVPRIHGTEQSFIEHGTYIGEELINGKYKVFFNKIDGPFTIDKENNIHKIFNLHMWSKNLKKFM